MNEKNQKISKLKQDLEFVELDERLEMIKIPTLSAFSCAEANGGCADGSCNNDTCNGACEKKEA